MKKTLSLRTLHRLSGGFVLLAAAALVGFGAYMWIGYGDLLVGEVSSQTSPTILTHLSSDKFEHAKKLLETRAALPYPPPALPNPFATPAPAQAPAPAPTPPATGG